MELMNSKRMERAFLVVVHRDEVVEPGSRGCALPSQSAGWAHSCEQATYLRAEVLLVGDGFRSIKIRGSLLKATGSLG